MVRFIALAVIAAAIPWDAVDGAISHAWRKARRLHAMSLSFAEPLALQVCAHRMNALTQYEVLRPRLLR